MEELGSNERLVLGPAPADARGHRRWGVGRKMLAYLLLAALAVFSIWYIDRRVHPVTPAATRIFDSNARGA
ncbi:MAG TPA: hypothetical protein VIL86_12030 [Tepidisphaeraceae bacterium]|jgi:hypothetical protein